MSRNIIIVLIAISVCLGDPGLKDIRYLVRNNGVEIHLSYFESINPGDIIAWKSDRSRLFITLLDIKPPLDKFPSAVLKGPVSSIVLDDFDGSTQLSIRFKKSILSYELINATEKNESIVFVHLVNSYVGKKRLNNYRAKEKLSSGFPEYKSAEFRDAFNRARMTLGPNAIFKYQGNFFVTNHPGENVGISMAGLQSKQERVNQLNAAPKKKISSFSPPPKSKNIYATDVHILKDRKDEILIQEEELAHELPRLDTLIMLAPQKPTMPLQDSYEIEPSVSAEFSIVNQPGFKNAIEALEFSRVELPELIEWIDLKTNDSFMNWNMDNVYPNKINQVPPKPDPELIQEELDYHKWYQVQERFSEVVSAGIRVTSNMNGVPVYIDGILVGETPLKGAVKVKPGMHQISGFTPVFARVMAHDGLYDMGHDPIITNNKSFGSQTIYVDSGNVIVVNLKFNRMGPVPKKLGELSGGMFIGFPVILALFGLITWGMI